MLKKFLIFILIVSLAVCTFGCGRTQTKNKKEKEQDDSRAMSIYSYKPDTFCPIASNNEANLRMLGIIYDGLITLGDNYLPQPALAESWSCEEGNTVWTVTLRKNAVWHSGSECVAEDVVYTVNQIKKLDNSPYSYNVRFIDNVSAVDTKSVRFTLNKPIANFINLLYFPVIKSDNAELDLVNFKPNGTGAYRLEDRNEGNVYYLVESENWWGGKAKTANIEVRMLPGGDTALYAFDSGTIDMTPVDNMDWGKFVDPGTAEYTRIPTPIYTFLGINHQNPQLAMPEVRRAISMIIDRNEVIDEARMGYGVSANSPMRSEWYMCQNQKFEHKPNTSMAKKLMEENGWEFVNNIYKKTDNGVVYTAAFDILINEDNTVRQNIARIMSKNLEAFGIKANVIKVPYDEYTKRIAEGNYDAFVGSMVLSAELDFNSLLGEGNVFSFRDEEMMFVMNQMQTGQSAEAVKASYAEFINLFEQLNPVIGLFFEDSVMIYSKQIEGDVSPTYYDPYRNIESITLASK